MANALVKGLGVPVDLEAADMWYEQAANKGHTEAAHALLELRASQGNVTAMAQLAKQKLTSSENPTDQIRGVVLLRRAAAAGHLDALYNLGECLRLGRGVAPDAAEAERCYEQAALQGHSSAQAALGALKATNERS